MPGIPSLLSRAATGGPSAAAVRRKPIRSTTKQPVSKLEDLQPGLHLAGVIPGQRVSVIAVRPHGPDAIELTYKTAEGVLGQRVLGRDAEDKLTIAQARARPLDAVAADFKLVAECQRIKLAGLSDPMQPQDQGAIGIRRERELVDRDLREGDGVHEEELVVAPAVDLLDLPAERVAVVERLGEGVLDPLALAPPLAMPAFDRPALDLERDDPALGMAEDEVALVVAGPLPGSRTIRLAE
ncbi:MAG TPA: hypothetical protein VNT32_10335 [Thermoleophilaceae bacterium]|nr:hypothetical protein [Thermoleophilaceae bacterium]